MDRNSQIVNAKAVQSVGHAPMCLYCYVIGGNVGDRTNDEGRIGPFVYTGARARWLEGG